MYVMINWPDSCTKIFTKSTFLLANITRRSVTKTVRLQHLQTLPDFNKGNLKYVKFNGRFHCKSVIDFNFLKKSLGAVIEPFSSEINQ